MRLCWRSGAWLAGGLFFSAVVFFPGAGCGKSPGAQGTAAQKEDGKQPVASSPNDTKPVSPEAWMEHVVRVERWPKDPELPANIVRRRDIKYGSAGERPISLDIVMRSAQPLNKRPAIVFVHGGGWGAGDRAQFVRQAGWLAERHDIVGACIEYRLSSEVTFPAALQDVKCAVRWLRSVAKEYNIDPERIAVCGGSAGGQLSAMTAVTKGVKEYEGDSGHAGFSSEVQLAILFNPALDLEKLAKRTNKPIDSLKAYLGGLPEEIPERYIEASPLKRVSPDAPPMLFLHGDEDISVSHEHSLEMSRQLAALGIPTEVEIYPGKGHAWFNNDPDWKITIERVEKFLVKHFKLE